MSIGLSFWLRKRSRDKWTRMHARADIARRLRQQWQDYGRRGRGSRAWRRAEVLARALDRVSVNPGAMAADILRDCRP